MLPSLTVLWSFALILCVAGAAYLIWIGGRMLWSAIRGKHHADIGAVAPQTKDSFFAGARLALEPTR